MTKLLHISASPRGEASVSLSIAHTFLETYRETHPGVEIETFDLWDGTLPEFGPVAAATKMAIFGGKAPAGEQIAVWQKVAETFRRFDSADRLLFSVPMWNAGIPYILKQFIDVISQPGLIFGVDPYTGYIPLLANKGKKVAVIYTSAVWGMETGLNFGSNFQSTYFNDWLQWTGITDISEVRYHPTLTGDLVAAKRQAHSQAQKLALDWR